MKFKKTIGALVAAASLLSVSTGASAADGVWDDGRWGSFSSQLFFSSDGGDLKVCVTSTTAKVALELDKGIYYTGRVLTTAGGSPTANCAIWRSIGSAGTYSLTFASLSHPSSVEVMIYD